MLLVFYYKMRQFYYKIRQLSQSATILLQKCNVYYILRLYMKKWLMFKIILKFKVITELH